MVVTCSKLFSMFAIYHSKWKTYSPDLDQISESIHSVDRYSSSTEQERSLKMSGSSRGPQPQSNPPRVPCTIKPHVHFLYRVEASATPLFRRRSYPIFQHNGISCLSANKQLPTIHACKHGDIKANDLSNDSASSNVQPNRSYKLRNHQTGNNSRRNVIMNERNMSVAVSSANSNVPVTQATIQKFQPNEKRLSSQIDNKCTTITPSPCCQLNLAFNSVGKSASGFGEWARFADENKEELWEYIGQLSIQNLQSLQHTAKNHLEHIMTKYGIVPDVKPNRPCDIFRKPAVKSKIADWKRQIKASKQFRPKADNAFVIADLIRQYLRELPESLISRFDTQVLRDIFTVVPDSLRAAALTDTMLNLPDCNRQALEAVLRFLHEFITTQNDQKSYPANARTRKRPSNFYILRGKHDMEQFALEDCLIYMIQNVNEIFHVKRTNCCRNHSTKSLKELIDNCRPYSGNNANIQTLISSDIKFFFRDLYAGTFGGQQLLSIQTNDVSIKCFYHPDECKLSPFLFYATINIQSEASNIAHCILNNRSLWDVDFCESRLVEQFQGADIIQYVTKCFHPLQLRSFCEFRYAQWVRSNPECKSSRLRRWIIIGSKSIEHAQNQFLPGVIANTDYSYFLIKPLSKAKAKSKITYIYRGDLRYIRIC